MRDFKKVEIHGEIYLYPVPVIKNNKYLIHCGSEIKADLIITAVSQKKIPHPDENNHSFVTKGYHTDGKTPIFVHENFRPKNK